MFTVLICLTDLPQPSCVFTKDLPPLMPTFVLDIFLRTLPFYADSSEEVATVDP